MGGDDRGVLQIKSSSSSLDNTITSDDAMDDIVDELILLTFEVLTVSVGTVSVVTVSVAVTESDLECDPEPDTDSISSSSSEHEEDSNRLRTPRDTILVIG